MPQRKATETLYMNADKTKLVKEGDPDAAFLFVRKGSAINDAESQRYGFKVSGSDVTVYDAIGDHEDKHGGETEAEAKQKRTAMLEGVPDPDGPAVEGERGEKATAAAPNTKAVAKAPANKAKV